MNNYQIYRYNNNIEACEIKNGIIKYPNNIDTNKVLMLITVKANSEEEAKTKYKDMIK